MAGPQVILLYMARPLPPQAIRANLMLYLLLVDILLLGLFAARGLLTPEPLLIGLCVMPLCLIAVWLGSAIFDPARERLCRGVAYAIISASALGGLPVWG